MRAFLTLCVRELPQLQALLDSETPPADCAAAIRHGAFLETLSTTRRQWLHEQGVIECVEIWMALGERFRGAIPAACAVIEKVVVSPDAGRLVQWPRE